MSGLCGEKKKLQKKRWSDCLHLFFWKKELIKLL
jgi:hypothetical protein